MSIRARNSRFVRPQLQILEDRTLPSCNVISGYVYVDANSNGLYDVGETPIAGSTLELRNADDIVVDTAVSDANGYYEFDHDSTIPLTAIETHTIQFDPAKTNTLQSLTVPKFDPALGKLNWIEITIDGSITSVISAENQDDNPVTIVGSVSGSLTVAGPKFSSVVMTSTNTESFDADAWDGVLDFGGTSGVTFDPNTVTGEQHLELHGLLDPFYYSGPGYVTITETIQANSSASGGGNLVAQITSEGEATVTIVYHYTPSDCLQSGVYTIVQTDQPAGYFDNLESSEGVVIPDSVGTDAIMVALDSTSVEHNDFGELAPASIQGIVYEDNNNNGLVDLGEQGIANVTVTLTGVNDLGEAVSTIALTTADGSFLFTDLRPGIYQLSETQPAGYLDGKDTVGSSGGMPSNDKFSQISIASGAAAEQYRFGELRPASLAGFVWIDANNDGVRAATEAGIAGVTVTLSGVDDLGKSVLVKATSAADGSYHFVNLRPGTYILAETQPTKYKDGKDALGSLGGTMTNDKFSNIPLMAGQNGVEYNFGELAPVVASALGGTGSKKSLINFWKKK
jgi:large repetitive protein